MTYLWITGPGAPQLLGPSLPLAQAQLGGAAELWGQPELSAFLAAGYLGLLTLMWLALLQGVGRWGRRWVLEEPQSASSDSLPLVSVCIPARNEAHQIGACVTAVLASDLPALEVIVVDDRSEDGTAAAAAAADDGTGRLKVIDGSEPPRGWAGKPWACSRAAGEARGAVLCFLDADVVVHPRALGALVQVLRHDQLSLVSAFGTWTLVGFWERALIPAIGWLIRGSVDLDRVHEPGRLEAFANGQLIIMERGAYEAVGGHKAVQGEVLEDVRLAKVVKRRGGRIGLRVAPWAFRVRLYRSLREIVQGYSKNLYEGMDRRPGIGLGAVLFILVGTLLPWLLVPAGLAARFLLGWQVPQMAWIAWSAAICGLQLAFRWRLDRADGRSGRDFWTHPIANAVLVLVLMRAVLGLEASWKGRRFVDGKAVQDT